MWDLDCSVARPEIVSALFMSFFKKGGHIFQGNVTDVEELRRAFCKVKEKQGIVLAQFFRLYYTDTPYPAHDAAKGYRYEIFDSAPYRDAELEVTVEAVGGTHASAAGDISALDIALKNGAISLSTYFELYPKDALSNRRELIEAIAREAAHRQTVDDPEMGIL